MSAFESLPIIDIGMWTKLVDENVSVEHLSFSSDHMTICRKWDDLMMRYGYAVLTNHGIDQTDFEIISNEARDFFSQPLNSKMEYNHGSYGHSSGGYTPPGYEKVALSTGDISDKAKFDPVENFVFTDYPSLFRKPLNDSGCPFPSADSYFRKIEKLLKMLHILSAASLGLTDLNFFHRCYDPTIPGNEELGSNGNALRIAHYPAFDHMLQTCVTSTSSVGEEFDDLVRYGAHTDYQGFTILKPDPRDWHLVTDPATGRQVQFGGLEVFLKQEQRWQQVKIPLGMNALVINAGDLIQRWTNDRWHSPLHRVINSRPLSRSHKADIQSGDEVVLGSKDVSRLAIVFFTGPLDECVVSPLPLSSEVGDIETKDGVKGAETRFAPIKAHDHLLLKLNRTNQETVV